MKENLRNNQDIGCTRLVDFITVLQAYFWRIITTEMKKGNGYFVTILPSGTETRTAVRLIWSSSDGMGVQKKYGTKDKRIKGSE